MTRLEGMAAFVQPPERYEPQLADVQQDMHALGVLQKPVYGKLNEIPSIRAVLRSPWKSAAFVLWNY